MSGFVILFICIGIINLVITTCASSNSKEANRRAQNESDKLYEISSHISNISEKIEGLLREDPGNTGSRAVQVYSLLEDYNSSIKEYNNQKDIFLSANQEAYNALEGHRFAQNFFGGGADDLGAISYYRNARNYHNSSIGISSYNVNPAVIQRAWAYVNLHKDKIGHSLPENTAGEVSDGQVTASASDQQEGQIPENSISTEETRTKHKSHKGLAAIIIVSGIVLVLYFTGSYEPLLKKLPISSSLDNSSPYTADANWDAETRKAEKPEFTEKYQASTDLSLYSEADTKSFILTTVPANDFCTVSEASEKDNGLINVDYNGTTGWVNKSALIKISTEDPAGTSSDPAEILPELEDGSEHSNSSESQSLESSVYEDIQDSIDYWNSPEGQQQMQDSIDYWNSPEGQQLMQQQMQQAQEMLNNMMQ